MPSPPASTTTHHYTFNVEGMVCSACEATVRNTAKGIVDVNHDSIHVSYSCATLSLDIDCNATPETPCRCVPRIITALEDVGFPATLPLKSPSGERQTPFDDLVKNTNNSEKFLWRSLIAALGGGILITLEMLSLISGPVMLAISILIMLYAGWAIYKDAFLKAKKRVTNMNTLVSLGSLFALAYAILLVAAPMLLPMSGGMHLAMCAGVFILAIVNFGSYLKAFARKKAMGDIPSLRDDYLQTQPATARKINPDNANESLEIPFEDIKKGDHVLVKAGEIFPIDGIVLTAGATILTDHRNLTGETTPHSLSTNDLILSGTLFRDESRDKSVRIQASSDGNEGNYHTRMCRIAKMDQTPENPLVERAVKWFTPSIILIALLAGLLWFFLGSIPTMGITVFISILLCACPCALGLAAPMAYLITTNNMIKNGILIQRAGALDLLAKVNKVIFDMTGTLTEGEMSAEYFAQVSDLPETETKESLLQKAASIEFAVKAKHPIAEAIIKANTLLRLNPMEAILDPDKRGARGQFNGKIIRVGNESYMRAQGIEIIPAELNHLSEPWPKSASRDGKVLTKTFVAIGNTIVAVIGATQRLRIGADKIIRSLKAKGIKTELLTGGQSAAAELIKTSLGMDSYRAEVGYHQKAQYINQQCDAGWKVAYVGDDGNDKEAVSVARAVGMAIHPDTPASRFAAITLSGSLNDLTKVMDAAKLTRSNIAFNIGFSFLFNLFSIALAAGAFGIMLNPILASALMGASSLSVILSTFYLNYLIQRKLNPKLTLWGYISSHWQKTSVLNKFIFSGLSVSLLLLSSTIIANVALGFSWNVIFNSMILVCTCCTGAVGILSAVGLMGLGAFLLVLGIKFAYSYYQSRNKAAGALTGVALPVLARGVSGATIATAAPANGVCRTASASYYSRFFGCLTKQTDASVLPALPPRGLSTGPRSNPSNAVRYFSRA